MRSILYFIISKIKKLQNKNSEIEEEYQELYDTMPKTTGTGTDITLNNTAKGKMSIEVSGNTEQDTNIITYTCNGTESGDYYFVYNNINYQFTMPSVSNGDVIYFNKSTLKLYLNTTEITTTTASTGTLITMTSSPNPDYPQDIRVVTGENTVVIENVDKTQEQRLPLSLSSKNKADLSTFEIGYIGSSGQVLKQGINNGEKASQYIKVKPNTTYTFTIVETQSQYGNWFGVGEYSNNDINNFIQRITMTIATQNYFTFTTSNTTKYVRLSARNLESATKIQFIESSTPATLETYQPYYNYELCKIGDYKDYIWKDESTGNWYVKKKTRFLNLAIINMNNSADYPGWILSQIREDLGSGKNGPLSNFTSFMSNIVGQNRPGVAVNTGSASDTLGTIWLSKSIWGLTQDQWKSNYPNLIFKLCYGLPTPTDIEIPDTTLINQLEAIYNTAKSYKTQTHIFTVTEEGNVSPILDVISLLDLNTIINS